MAHKAIIACDRCGAEERTGGGRAYPDGWQLVTLTWWASEPPLHPGGTNINRQHRDADLCPACAAPIKEHLKPKESP